MLQRMYAIAQSLLGVTVFTICSTPRLAAGSTFAPQLPINHAPKARLRSLVTNRNKEYTDAATYSVASAPVSSIQIDPTVSSSQVQLAPVSNQSADARTSITASIRLLGQGLIPFGQEQRQVLMTALSASVTASTHMALTNMELMSVSEFMPNNTTSSPAPSRRLLVKRTLSGEHQII